MQRLGPKSPEIKTLASLPVLTILLAGTWSPLALSASWSESDCGESADDMLPELTLDGLTLDPVDHPVIEPTQQDLEQTVFESATREQVTPFLYLAPRVASVLKDAFGDDQEPLEAADTPSSPLAERDEVMPFPRPVDNDIAKSDEFAESGLQLLQRQMYRIDI